MASAFNLLQECSHKQYSCTFKKFDDLAQKLYCIEKYMLINSLFGLKIGVVIKDEVEGRFIINLPSRFDEMANQSKVDELNKSEDKGFMLYLGKDQSKKDRILLEFVATHQLKTLEDDNIPADDNAQRIEEGQKFPDTQHFVEKFPDTQHFEGVDVPY